MKRQLLLLCLLIHPSVKPMENTPSLSMIDGALISKAPEKEKKQIVDATRVDRVDATDADGKTRLHWAVFLQDLQSIKDLLALGANPNAINTAGATPLHFAAYFYTDKMSPAIIETLLNAGADPEFMKRSIQSPIQLMLLKYLDQRSPQAFVALKSFIDRTKNLDIQDQRGNTLLYLLVAPLKNTLITDDVYAVIASMLARKANPNIQNKDGFTPLHAAVSQQNVELVKLLLASGANPHIRSYQPRTYKQIQDAVERIPDKTPLQLAKEIKAATPAHEQINIIEIEKLLRDATSGAQPLAEKK